MKVKELIEHLQLVDPNHLVIIMDHKGNPAPATAVSGDGVEFRYMEWPNGTRAEYPKTMGDDQMDEWGAMQPCIVLST